MSDVTTLLDAVSEIRSGSGLSRARASMTALQTLMQMSPEDKRAMAVLVAERAAPQLVDRIESGTGQDLSKDQVETVLKMFQQLDADDLSELRVTVTDAERRGSALTDITRAAGATAATAAGLEELIPRTQAEDAAADAPGNPAGEADPETHGAAEGPQREAEVEVEAEVAAALAAQDQELAQLEAEAEELKAEARAAQVEPVPTSSPTPEPVPQRTTSLFDELGELDEHVGPAVHDDEPEPATPAPIPITRDRTSQDHEVRAALRAATSVSASLRIFRAHAATQDDEDHLLSLLLLVPDGWGRRCAVTDLLDRDLLHGTDAVEALTTLAGAGDRRFVTGSILAGGFATPEQLRGAVDDRTLDRIAARAEHDPEYASG